MSCDGAAADGGYRGRRTGSLGALCTYLHSEPNQTLSLPRSCRSKSKKRPFASTDLSRNGPLKYPIPPRLAGARIGRDRQEGGQSLMAVPTGQRIFHSNGKRLTTVSHLSGS